MNSDSGSAPPPSDSKPALDTDGHIGGPTTGPGPVVGVLMGSISDRDKMLPAIEILDRFGVAYEFRVVSAHRMPEEMLRYGSEAAGRGLKVLIAAAGGAAHLPGMLAAVTSLPVIGVPISLKNLDGLDSLLSIVQMPRGVPVATVAVDNSTNAALLAIRILGVTDAKVAAALDDFRVEQRRSAEDSNREL